MSESLGARVARNASAAFGGQVVSALLSLVAMGVIAKGLGVAAFGAWSLVAVLIAYSALMDLGLGVALVRRVADADSRGDAKAAGAAVGAALAATLVLGVITVALIWLVAPGASAWLKVPDQLRGPFITALRVAAAGAALALPGAVLGAVPTALQQLGRVVRLEVGVTLVVVALQVVVIALDKGLAELAAAYSAGRVLSLAGRWVLARRMLPGVPFRAGPGYPFWTSLGRFGAVKVAHQLLSQLVLYFDRLLVGALVSVEAVAWYTVAMELAQRLLMIPGNIAQAYYPAACAVATDRAAFSQLYRRASRAVLVLTVPLAILLAIVAEPLLALWVGPEMTAAAPIMRIVLLAYAGMALTSIPATAADALNHPALSLRFGVVSAALNIGLALVLIPRLGAVGAAWAVAINVLLLTPPFLITVGRLVNR